MKTEDEWLKVLSGEFDYDDKGERGKFVAACGSSPIERVFVAALFATRRWRPCLRTDMGCLPESISCERFLVGTRKLVVRAVAIPQLQWKLGSWPIRMDLGVLMDTNGRGTPRSTAFAVELDGHEFHERTKEQARSDRSRDRKLSSLGWLPVRFTGSEIWEDPLDCADDFNLLLQSSPGDEPGEAPLLRPQHGAKP